MNLPPHVREAVAAVAADPPPLPAGWPHAGRAWPVRELIYAARKAGWPIHETRVMLPQTGHRPWNAGRPLPLAEQPVTCVPMTWMRDLCRRLGARLTEFARGTIEDEAPPAAE